MVPNILSEIADYLKHQDYSLVVRRMLDASLDTGAPALIRKAIQFSQQYREAEKQHPGAPMPADFLAMAEQLLQEAAPYYSSAAPLPQELLNATGVSKTYSKGSFQLKPVSLKISSGEIMGIVGENGMGKTTLLRCLGGQLAIDGGAIQYSLLQKPDAFDIRKYIAFIPQRIPRWYGLLKDNLHFSASIAGVHGEENLLMVDYIIERLNLGAYAHLDWNQISSGYRTRFEIARILLQKPKLLILDEPLANLDINAQQTILTDLRFIAKSVKHSMGVILSSQQLHEVEKIADAVLFIKQGSCLFQTGVNQPAITGNVIEVETTAAREQVAAILGDEVQIQFNGGFFTISSESKSVQEMIGALLKEEMPVTYFRDITHSTKRFF